ncbi:MAG: TIGR04255 family protein [Peptostreptococcaceae bacterium]
MKNNIKRSNINYNFLKKIIVRVDYNGILERELEKTVGQLKDILKGKNFIRFEESYINQVDFEIKDPEQIETQRMIPIQEINKTKSYVFSNENNLVQVIVSKYYTSITVDYGKYIKFEEICVLFKEIYNIIKNNNNYMRILRLGLRKINNCILLDLDRLNDIIEVQYFSNLNSLFDDCKSLPILNKQNIDTFIYRETNVNLIRFLSSGVLERNGKEQDAYQLVFDIDSYRNEEEFFEINIKSSDDMYEQLLKLNNILFKTYISILNEKFVEMLVNGNIDKDLLMGVEKNYEV